MRPHEPSDAGAPATVAIGPLVIVGAAAVSLSPERQT